MNVSSIIFQFFPLAFSLRPGFQFGLVLGLRLGFGLEFGLGQGSDWISFLTITAVLLIRLHRRSRAADS